MKLRTKQFKPNTVICIFTDLKKSKDYMVDITTRKFYSNPQRVKDNTKLYAPIGVAFVLIIRRFSDQLRAQLYLSEASQSFKILLIVVGILVGFLVFCLGSKIKNKHIFHLDEYLKQYPQSEMTNSINEIIEKGSNVAVVNLVLILGGGIGSVMMFDRFLSNSNLSTYFFAILLFTISSLLFSRIKEFIFILGLKPEKPFKNE